MEAFTFIYLQSPDDAPFSSVWIKLDKDFVAYQYPNMMQTHLAGKVRKYSFA